MADIILKENIVKHLNENHPFSFYIFEVLDSTNTFAKELSKQELKHLSVVIADRQTNGRGRLGRDFFSPAGTGIYMSVMIDPKKINLSPSLLTVAGGVAVCRAISSVCESKPMIKWVNDIFVNGKKVSGILAESILGSNSSLPDAIILGIGVNVSTPQDVFPGKLNEIAGSIFPPNTDRNAIIAKILAELDNIFKENNVESLIEEYKESSLVLGKKISFTQDGKAYTAIATDINMEGNLVVRLDSGNEVILKSGEVSLGSSSFLKDNL